MKIQIKKVTTKIMKRITITSKTLTVRPRRNTPFRCFFRHTVKGRRAHTENLQIPCGDVYDIHWKNLPKKPGSDPVEIKRHTHPPAGPGGGPRASTDRAVPLGACSISGRFRKVSPSLKHSCPLSLKHLLTLARNQQICVRASIYVS